MHTMSVIMVLGTLISLSGYSTQSPDSDLLVSIEAFPLFFLSLGGLEEQSQSTWGGLDSQLSKRHDLTLSGSCFCADFYRLRTQSSVDQYSGSSLSRLSLLRPSFFS